MTRGVTCAKPGESTVDRHRSLADIPGPAWENRFHRVCTEKNLGQLPRRVIHRTRRHDCGERGAAPHPAAPFPHTERTRATRPATPINRHARSRSDRLRRTGPAGYPSCVCSIRGEAIDRIAEAIDQLANDARREIPGTDLAARVADIWLMVTALDPELARRQRRYTTSTAPADGAPSP